MDLSIILCGIKLYNAMPAVSFCIFLLSRNCFIILQHYFMFAYEISSHYIMRRYNGQQETLRFFQEFSYKYTKYFYI